MKNFAMLRDFHAEKNHTKVNHHYAGESFVNWVHNQAYPCMKESRVKLLKLIDFDLCRPQIYIEEKVSALEKARSVRSKRSSNADLPYSVPAPVPLSAKMFFV